MKPLSNTSIAAIFAVGLTFLIGVLLQIPFFKDKETQTSDEMMLLRYQINSKHSKDKPDSRIVIAAIDQKSLGMLGRWPFSRSVHGDFLILLAPEKPKALGWDIFFTEPEKSETAPVQPPAAGPTTPSGTPPASGPTTAPASPDSQPSGTPPASTNAAAASLNGISIGADLPGAASTIPSTPPNSAPAPTPSPSALSSGDQHLVDAASLFPNMVTAAEASPDPQDPDDPFTPNNILPTRPLTHITGDVTKLISAPSAILPFPALRKKSYFGFANENGESGGGSRRTDPMVVSMDGKIMPSFDLQVLMQYWGVDPDQVFVTLGHDIILPRPDGTKARIPIDEKGQMALNYRAQLEDFKGMSYYSMMKGMNDDATGEKSEERAALPPIKDSIIIVGATFNGIDAGPTPLGSNTPLVVTHLNALNNILQQDFVKPVHAAVWMPIYALFLFGAGSLMLRVGIAPMIPIGALALAVLAAAAFATLYFGNYLVPIATPELGILLLAGAVPTKRFFGEEREKLRVKSAMRAYLSDKVMNKILAHPDGVKLGGVKQVITIMFCDIRGFTRYCDNRDPQEVLNVVNEYFEEMTQVVFKYEGTVDKYIGDCIMAFWNAPEDQPDHAQRAVCCAMEMRYALANFKVKRAGLDTELFECGIGIHTGEALVGNMGSSLKVNYTAMGSTVNLGARLESLTKTFNERILISQATLDALTGDFPITDRGEAVVPGFANPIHIYGVGAEQDLSSAIKVGLKLAKKQEYTAEEVTKPIWAPAPLPEDADPNP